MDFIHFFPLACGIALSGLEFIILTQITEFCTSELPDRAPGLILYITWVHFAVGKYVPLRCP